VPQLALQRRRARLFRALTLAEAEPEGRPSTISPTAVAFDQHAPAKAAAPRPRRAAHATQLSATIDPATDLSTASAAVTMIRRSVVPVVATQVHPRNAKTSRSVAHTSCIGGRNAP
jgi:hypothetical protein